MKYLLMASKQTAIPYHLLCGLTECGIDVKWFGEWSAYLNPIPNWVKRQRISTREAFLSAGRGIFDVVIVCDRKAYLPESKSKTVLIDTMDDPGISINHLSIADIYFKCQLPRDRKEWLITDGRGKFLSLERLGESPETYHIFETNQERIRPFPYSTFIPPSRTKPIEPTREIFFLGWDSRGASQRREIVTQLKEASQRGLFSFTGGLFKREDLSDQDPPEELRHPPIKPINLYNSTCRDFKINIVPRSNGQLSFRLYELLSLGCFVLAEELDVPILPREPEDRKHLVFFKHDLSDLVDLCLYYLSRDDERRRIALSGHRFYWEHLTPKRIAEFFISHIGV